MRPISTFILAVVIVLPVLLNAFTCLSFAVNQDEIIALFCVNKDKPVMKCNGKCHLAKILKGQSSREDNKLLPSYYENFPFLCALYPNKERQIVKGYNKMPAKRKELIGTCYPVDIPPPKVFIVA